MTILGRIISWPFRLLMQPDKQGHLYWGLGIAYLALWFNWWAMVPVVICAFGKEVWDRAHPPHDPDRWDAICTITGGLIGCGLIAFYKAHHP